MTYEIVYTIPYLKKAKRFLREHPGLRERYMKTMNFLEVNPFHPSLRLHSLSGKHAGYHSVSINMSYRITIEFLIVDNEITPIDIGNHEEVY